MSFISYVAQGGEAGVFTSAQENSSPQDEWLHSDIVV